MTDSPGFFAETITSKPQIGSFDDALRALRVSGGILLRERYAAPWAVAVPASDQLGTLLGLPASTRVVAFHLVEYGHCEVQTADGQGLLLNAGELAICFGGDAHRIAVGRPARPQPLAELLAGEHNRQAPAAGGAPPATTLTCGVFQLQHARFNPLLEALPPVLQASLSRPGELHNLAGVARLLHQELERPAGGSAYVVERLLELLCADALRAHADALPRDAVGWFSGVRDPVVGRALAAIHAAPGSAWTVRRLASHVAMSPSRFAARFAASLGCSPMVYVARWRMNLACRRLSGTHDTIERIAAEVGYDNTAAFNRAFKKHLALPPAAWRHQARRVGASG